MTVITYTAKRRLIPSHTANTLYTIEPSLMAINEMARIKRHSLTSIGGVRKTVHWHTENRWDITTDELSNDDVQLWREFYASVESGEAFTFDPYGTPDVPGNPFSAVLIGNTFAPKRKGKESVFTLNLSFVEQ